MKETDIFLIRHAQTTMNAQGRALGRSDIGLTEDGVREAQGLATHLKEKGIRPQIIYTSPLKRAKQTADELRAGLGGIVEEKEALREINYGVYEGSDRTVLREIEFGYNSEKMLEGKGETAQEVEQRVAEFLDEVLAKGENSILIVTSAFVASIMTQIFMNVPRTFETIQPLQTADYSHFKVKRVGKNDLNVLTIQTNFLKGPLNIND